jgi:hypothetical protein
MPPPPAPKSTAGGLPPQAPAIPAASSPSPPPAPVNTNTFPVPSRGGWLATTKDVVGLIQSLVAIGAIVCGGVWFFMQRPFDPTVKTTTNVSVTEEDGYYLVFATATFENVGKIPYHFNCWGVNVYSDSEPLPPATCGAEVTLGPGQQKVVSDLITVPFNLREQERFFSAEIGTTRDSGWDPTSQTALQALLLPPVNAAASNSTKPGARAKSGSPNTSSKSVPSSIDLLQKDLKQAPRITERMLTPEEMEKEWENVHGVA